MVRTKYLVVAIFVCVAVIFSVGVLPHNESSSTGYPLNNNAVFAIPKEHYTVAGTSLDTRMKEREAFKARVQATLRAEPVSTTEAEDIEEDFVVTTPTEIVPEGVPMVVTPETLPDTIPTTTVIASPTTTPSSQVATTSAIAPAENSEI